MIDVKTAFFLWVIQANTLAILLVAIWLHARDQKHFLWFGIGFLFHANGLGLVGMRGQIPDFISIQLANTISLLGFSFWAKGLAALDHRRGSLLFLLPPLLWIAGNFDPSIRDDFAFRVSLYNAGASIGFAILAAIAWRARFGASRDRTLLTFLWGMQAIAGIGHIALVLHLRPTSFTDDFFGMWMGTFVVICFITSAVILAKITMDRSEEQLQALVRTDPLTGALNRRGFSEAYQRLVEISLAAGDTADALEAQRRVVSSFTPGSVDHRRARALELRLQGVVVPPGAARAALEAFRDEFPQAPELDALAAEVARTLVARGDAEGAEAVLEGMAGPRASLERGYLLLAGERPDEARRAFLMALPGLEPSEATTVIQFVSLLARLSPAGGGVLARAGTLARQGRGEEAAASVSDALEDLPEEDRPPLLAEGARLADRAGAAGQGAGMRRRLLDDYPDSPEAAEGALLLARFRAGEPDGKDEAIRILEDLVVGSPEAPVVPDARRELERLRRSR